MFATIRKELLLLLRDPGGLLLLLIMPAALIIVMAVVQDAPYRDYQEMKFDILVVNKDSGPVGRKIVDGLNKNRQFAVLDSVDGQRITESYLQDALQKGSYKMGIVIPENASIHVVSFANKLANNMAGSLGMSASLPVKENTGKNAITLFFDPVVKPSFRSSLNFALNQYLTQTKMEILLDRLGKMNGDTAMLKNLDEDFLNVLAIQEATPGQAKVIISSSMNSVQHNVPAWAIFGMFLIVVPLSGNMIRERDEGSALRIRLIPDATRKVGLGKIVFYIMVCMLQFFVMMLVGTFLLPYLGLPRLQLGVYPMGLLPVVFAIAFAAVSYGYFIGSIFKTANQAMPFGAISVVLLSALGGVWVPVEILPSAMQRIALLSPMHWGLDGINAVVLRQQGIDGIVYPVLVLTTLGILFSVLPVFFGKK